MLYHAMDEPGAVCEWRPIGAPENDDMVHSATMRIVEAVSVATMHTFRSVKYTSFLKKYGMVETETSGFGANKTSAMKDFIPDKRSVSETAMQLVTHQAVNEYYDGPQWTYETLPVIVQEWLSAEGFSKVKTVGLLKKHNISTLAKAIQKEIIRSAGKGSAIREMTIQQALAGGEYKLASSGTFTLLNISFTIPSQQRREHHIADKVYVEFPMTEHRSEQRWARDALSTDPGSRLGVLVSGKRADNGADFTFWLKAVGEKRVKEANSIVDWLTDTGIAVSEHQIPRRVYYRHGRKKDGKKYCEITYT